MNIIDKIKELRAKTKNYLTIPMEKEICFSEGKRESYDEVISLLESEQYIQPPKYKEEQTVYHLKYWGMNEGYEIIECIVLNAIITVSSRNQTIDYKLVTPNWRTIDKTVCEYNLYPTREEAEKEMNIYLEEKQKYN